MHRDYPERGRHLHAQVALFYHHFKLAEDSPAEDDGVWVIHVDYVEGYCFGADPFSLGE